MGNAKHPGDGGEKPKKKKQTPKTVAENKKARFNYFIEDTIITGISLVGTEVKSLRTGKANIAESYANIEKGELWLINADIAIYSKGNRFNHEPRRHRKLLVTRKQLNKLKGVLQQKGQTLIPLKLFFDENGRAKLDLGICKGKQLHDKRETLRDRDWDRQKQRLMRTKI